MRWRFGVVAILLVACGRVDFDDATPCTDGAMQIVDRGHCYMMFAGRLDYSGASAACGALGTHLVSVTDDREQQHIAQIAVVVAPDQFGRRDMYMAGTDMGSEGMWRWETGETWQFMNWRSGEPSNSQGVEHCLIMEGEPGRVGTWDDRECADQYAYVCERDP